MSRNQNLFWQGVIAGAPFVLVVIPFSLLFGVVATESGLDLVQTMAMTVLVIAGAAQFAAVQLLVDHAPTLVIILTGLAVNLRMAMYSASLAPHLGKAPFWQRAIVGYFLVDQSYAVAMQKFEAEPALTPAQKIAFFAGTMVLIAPLWYLFTYVGAVAGAAIPDAFALDFAVPITFLALIGPSLRSLPHLLAALVSVAVSLALAWMPYNLWLLIAALAAMVTGAQIELWQGRRRHG